MNNSWQKKTAIVDTAVGIVNKRKDTDVMKTNSFIEASSLPTLYIISGSGEQASDAKPKPKLKAKPKRKEPIKTVRISRFWSGYLESKDTPLWLKKILLLSLMSQNSHLELKLVVLPISKLNKVHIKRQDLIAYTNELRNFGIKITRLDKDENEINETDAVSVAKYVQIEYSRDLQEKFNSSSLKQSYCNIPTTFLSHAPLRGHGQANYFCLSWLICSLFTPREIEVKELALKIGLEHKIKSRKRSLLTTQLDKWLDSLLEAGFIQSWSRDEATTKYLIIPTKVLEK